ncbi:YcaC amidohydrolase [Pseudovirgaria hyperparasitica]|uniref:YcaC amidohydrolase n=1 Tax=Pseudovirgaria hyperparasitica TaxID=470096 RepID=A0A6A6W1Q9_9PEZI|nr:YcaC amidohydrolase [Pseudovirgaria hyperparasitica]KAF2755507.1 YcaC amidohydrolase [Pseudovirgaria hyperparasitica]
MTISALCIALTAVVGIAIADAVPFERLDINNSVLLIVDEQVGLYHVARDFDPTLFYNNILAHSAIGNIFDIPVIMTTSAQEGPNGPLPREILEMYPNAPLIRRNGEVNAWDNAEFREAVRATNRTQMIVGGIVTDVCTSFLSLSLRAEGYSVWANVEASGTTTELLRDTANLRMHAAGVQLVSWFAIVMDLMRDWRNPPGTAGMLPVIEKYFPAYAFIAKSHGAAVQNGTIIDGEQQLL